MKFTAADFEADNAAGVLIPEQIARIANRKLEAWLESHFWLYGKREQSVFFLGSPTLVGDFDIRGRLVAIEDLDK